MKEKNYNRSLELSGDSVQFHDDNFDDSIYLFVKHGRKTQNINKK